MELLVPDASIIFKWFLGDEPHPEKANLILDGYIQGAHQLLIPDYAHYEVASVLTLPKNGLSYQRARKTLLAFRRLRIPSIPFKVRKLKQALELTYEHNIRTSYYDALYVAIAKNYGGKWITADWKAYRRLKKLDYVEWIGYWTPSKKIKPTTLF